MPVIVPTLNAAVAGVPRVIWEGAVTGDTFTPLALKQQFGLAASVQVVGTFGGATVTMQVSNDGTNWVTATNIAGGLVSMTATGYHELSLSAAYMRPTLTSGSGNDVDIILVLRGSNGV